MFHVEQPVPGVTGDTPRRELCPLSFVIAPAKCCSLGMSVQELFFNDLSRSW